MTMGAPSVAAPRRPPARSRHGCRPAPLSPGCGSARTATRGATDGEEARGGRGPDRDRSGRCGHRRGGLPHPRDARRERVVRRGTDVERCPARRRDRLRGRLAHGDGIDRTGPGLRAVGRHRRAARRHRRGGAGHRHVLRLERRRPAGAGRRLRRRRGRGGRRLHADADQGRRYRHRSQERPCRRIHHRVRRDRRVSGDQLSAGTWRAVLSYSSDGHSGTAEPVDVEVSP